MLTKTLAALAISVAAIAGPVSTASASPTHVTTSSHAHPVDRLGHPCTHTSSGTCIRGGQFCPQAAYGHSGWDAVGRRYVCKGDHVHPHWMVP